MVEAPSSSSSSRNVTTVGLLILEHGQKRIIIPRPASYEAALNAVHRHFPGIPQGTAVLQTADLGICGGEMAEITEESWGIVIPLVSSITATKKLPAPPQILAVGPLSDSETRDDQITIRVVYRELTFTLHVEPQTPVNAILEAACDRFVLDRGEFRATMKDIPLGSQGPHVEDYDMVDGDEIIIRKELRLRKPVIYFFSPTALDIIVTLSLVPEWSFSVLYPVVPTKGDHGERVQWNVRVHPDGTLTETNTNLDVAYLFWEAHTNSGAPTSPPPSPNLSQEHFNPASSTLDDSNSVLLPVKDITPYLDKALKALGLHTEARTSFITYWLPSFLKHTHVALRFVPQRSYSRAAPLDIVPAPDVVTRVFMLFKGIPVDSVAEWPGAMAKAEVDVGLWKTVVGVDLEKALDTQLFRVLEWGGMEVLAS